MAKFSNPPSLFTEPQRKEIIDRMKAIFAAGGDFEEIRCEMLQNEAFGIFNGWRRSDTLEYLDKMAKQVVRCYKAKMSK